MSTQRHSIHNRGTVFKCAMLVAAMTMAGCGTGENGSSSSSSSSNSNISSNPPVSSSSSISSSSSSEGIPAGSTLVYAINAGGAVTTLNGEEYQADRFSTGGSPNIVTDPIAGVNQDTLYQSERYGTYRYEIPVSNSTYSVRLHFVEMFHEAAGARLFSLSVEGQPVVQNIDLYDLVGHDTAYEVIASNIMVADESLTIELTTEIDNATLSGFAIYSDDGGQFVEPPEPEPGETLPSAGCGTSRSLQNGRRNIGNRSYILRAPNNYDNTNPYRLVIAYHWLNGNADQVASGGMGGSTEAPYYGLWDLANDSTIFVAPEGLNGGWANSGGGDVQFTDEILEQILGDMCIDESRIFATGFSFGGAMSNALACARPDKIRGVAVYSTSPRITPCTTGNAPNEPVAYLGIHGANDDVLSIAQGRSMRDGYVSANSCSNTNAPEPAGGSGTHICTSFQGCSEGYPVRWCAHGGGHNPTEYDQGANSSWVPGEAWQFISQF